MGIISIIIFVCEHAAAKSNVAAAYFNELAGGIGLALKAPARGLHPDQELSPSAVRGLRQDGLHSIETVPCILLPADLQSDRRVIAFCTLPGEYRRQAEVQVWSDVPSVGENYITDRDVILKQLDRSIVEVA